MNRIRRVASADRSKYGFLWFRLLLTTAVACCLFKWAIDFLTDFVLVLKSIDAETMKQAKDSPQGVALQILAGTLFWWRFVKVTVLLGSPFKFGVMMAGGRENGGNTGRLVTHGHIGNLEKNRVLFGIVVRSHPSSDKIMRSRLQLLLMSFFGLTFQVQESRFIFGRSSHERRANVFREAIRPYIRKDES